MVRANEKNCKTSIISNKNKRKQVQIQNNRRIANKRQTCTKKYTTQQSLHDRSSYSVVAHCVVFKMSVELCGASCVRNFTKTHELTFAECLLTVQAMAVAEAASVESSSAAPSYFDDLSDVLAKFSHDLIWLVCGYLMFPCAGAAGTKSWPKRLTQFSIFADARYGSYCEGVACTLDRRFVAGIKRVYIFDADGKFLKLAAIGSWRWACGVAIAGQSVFISDHDTHSIVVLRPDGSFDRLIGAEGKGKCRFDTPLHIAIDSTRRLLFVCDSGNRRVQVLALGGAFVNAFGSFGTTREGQFEIACGIALNTKAGEVAVGDARTARIQVRPVCVAFVAHLHAGFGLQRSFLAPIWPRWLRTR